MLRSPRFWFAVAGGWLLLTGLAHTAAHVWTFVFENGMIGLREFAMNAMKQARSPDPLQPSLWNQFRTFSLSFSLLLLFTGGANLLFARIRASAETLRALALWGTVFWTVAFIPFAFVDPVIQAIVIAAVAVPLHAIAYVTASIEAESGDAVASGDAVD